MQDLEKLEVIEALPKRGHFERVGKQVFDGPETGVRCRLETIQERQFSEQHREICGELRHVGESLAAGLLGACRSVSQRLA